MARRKKHLNILASVKSDLDGINFVMAFKTKSYMNQLKNVGMRKKFKFVAYTLQVGAHIL